MMRTSPIAADENRDMVSDKPKTLPFNPFQQQQQQQQTPIQQQQQTQHQQQQTQQQQQGDQTPQAPPSLQTAADKEKELREMLQKKRQVLMERVAERDRMMLRIDSAPKPLAVFTATDQPVNTAISANQNIVDSNLRAVAADDMMGNGDEDADEDGDGDGGDDDNWMGDAQEDEDGDGDEADDADNSLNISNTSDNRPSLQAPSLTPYQSITSPIPIPIPTPTSIPTPLPLGPGQTPTRDLPTSSSSKGSCEGMCPLQERRQRIEENDVHKLEYPSSV